MTKAMSGLALAAILGLTAVLLFLLLTNGQDWGDDFAGYILQARSLVQGTPAQFIKANEFTIYESTSLVGPVAYPWGGPVLLAPLYALWGLNMPALKSVSVICFLLFLVCLWFGFRRQHSDLGRVLLVCLFAFNPGILNFTNNIVSDMPFLFLSTLTVIFAGRVIIERRSFASPAIDALLLGIIAALACFVRPNGVVLVAMLFFMQLIETGRRVSGPTSDSMPAGSKNIFSRFFQRARQDWAVLVLPYVSLGAAILAWRAIFPSEESSHLGNLRNLSLALIKEQAIYYVKLPAEFFLPLPQLARYLVYGACLVLAFAGMLRRHSSDYHMIIYSGLTLLLYIIWPGVQGLRFLFPVLPFLLSFAISGLETKSRDPQSATNFWRRAALVPGLCLVFFFGVSSLANGFANLSRERMEQGGPYTPASQEVLSYLTKNTEPDSVVVFFKPRLLRLFTERRSVLLDDIAKVERCDYLCLYLPYQEQYPGDHDQLARDQVEKLLKNNQLQLLFSNSDFELYRIRKTLHARIPTREAG